MAYLNFSEVGGISAAPVAREDVREQGLSGLEWSVVALAQRDSIASLSEPGRIATALGLIFGSRPNPRLADQRLEALRRMAVFAWHHGYAAPAAEIRAFLKSGFTEDQYETLLASISRGRAALRKKRN